MIEDFYFFFEMFPKKISLFHCISKYANLYPFFFFFFLFVLCSSLRKTVIIKLVAFFFFFFSFSFPDDLCVLYQTAA